MEKKVRENHSFKLQIDNSSVTGMFTGEIMEDFFFFFLQGNLNFNPFSLNLRQIKINSMEKVHHFLKQT